MNKTIVFVVSLLFAFSVLVNVNLQANRQPIIEPLGGNVQGDMVSVNVGLTTFLAVRGADNGVYLKWFNSASPAETAWSPDRLNWYALGGITAFAPSIAVSDAGQIAVVIRGQRDEPQGLIFNGDTWGTWKSLTGVTIDTPSLGWVGERLIVSVLGEDQDIYVRTYEAGKWDVNWRALGVRAIAAPHLLITNDDQWMLIAIDPSGSPFTINLEGE